VNSVRQYDKTHISRAWIERDGTDDGNDLGLLGFYYRQVQNVIEIKEIK
jgi:hypothetical protein